MFQVVLLKKAVDNQDINGIERIAKIYNYVFGILECIGCLIYVIFKLIADSELIIYYNNHTYGYHEEAVETWFIYVFPLLTLFAVSCIRIHATRTNDNGLLGRLKISTFNKYKF